MKKSSQESSIVSPFLVIVVAVLLVVSVATLAGYRLNLSAEVDGKGKFQINLDPPAIQEAKK